MSLLCDSHCRRYLRLPARQLLGALWNWTLYGALVVQTCEFHSSALRVLSVSHWVKTYTVTISRTIECHLSSWACTLFGHFMPFSNDTSTVLAVFLLETSQTALCGTDLYHWFASGFGNMDRLNAPHFSAFDVPIIGSIVSLVVQFFFVFRIWVLSRKTSWPLCFTICLVSRWYNSHTNIRFPTLSTFQVSTLDAIAAFGGGVYVSHVRPELSFPIWLMSVGTHTREVHHWPGAKNCCVGETIISEK